MIDARPPPDIPPSHLHINEGKISKKTETRVEYIQKWPPVSRQPFGSTSSDGSSNGGGGGGVINYFPSKSCENLTCINGPRNKRRDNRISPEDLEHTTTGSTYKPHDPAVAMR